MTELRAIVTSKRLSHAKASEMFGVTEGRISDLMNGRVSKFELDALVKMVAVARMHIELKIDTRIVKVGASKRMGLELA